MRGSLLKSVVLSAAIIVSAFAGSIYLSAFLERHHPPLAPELADADLSLNGSRLKGFVFGAEGLIADWYFIRSLQYIGDKIVAHKGNINIDDLRELNPRLLYPLLENATDLDPHFIAAYSYGALVLPAIDEEKAIALAAKGIKNNPGEWRLYQYLGYIYWKLGRYDLAAETYEKGAAVQGASSFMRLMAAAMKTEGGSRETARLIYREMLAEPGDEQTLSTAEHRLKELDMLDQREAIDKTLVYLKDRNGRCTASLTEITGMLRTVKLPAGRQFTLDKADRLVDPFGKPYVLDKINCRLAPSERQPQQPGK